MFFLSRLLYVTTSLIQEVLTKTRIEKTEKVTYEVTFIQLYENWFIYCPILPLDVAVLTLTVVYRQTWPMTVYPWPERRGSTSCTLTRELRTRNKSHQTHTICSL